MTKTIGIYIHIPFCLKKCLYCDFHSVSLRSYRPLKEYCRALKQDIKISTAEARGYSVKSIYFGGGTPSLLEPEELAGLVRVINERFYIMDDAEKTLEVNPATVNTFNLKAYRRLGINRISLGVQAFDDKYLRLLGRLHTSKDVFLTIKLLRKSGFKNISIDLMYALPEQALASWEKDIDTTVSLGVEHVSFYDLTVEKGTPFYRMRNKLKQPNQDEQARMYKGGCAKLKKAGYVHYEISSFAKKGRESRHNCIYWLNEEYMGVGSGAYSYINGTRFGKDNNLKRYMDEAAQCRISRFNAEELRGVRRYKETLMLNLRILRGFSIKEVQQRLGSPLPALMKDRLVQLVSEGLVLNKGDCYRLSSRGILLYDVVAGVILE
ncbi:MAG: radical SAM family heme chaperone HemW [Candidatus Omnitrophica bacterium]|nr:radical SAM family heme chaperone HemW [Candidatus Omnitrophota bacterium]